MWKLLLVFLLAFLPLVHSYSDVTLTIEEYEEVMTALENSETALKNQENKIENLEKQLERLESLQKVSERIIEQQERALATQETYLKGLRIEKIKSSLGFFVYGVGTGLIGYHLFIK